MSPEVVLRREPTDQTAHDALVHRHATDRMQRRLVLERVEQSRERIEEVVRTEVLEPRASPRVGQHAIAFEAHLGQRLGQASFLLRAADLACLRRP